MELVLWDFLAEIINFPSLEVLTELIQKDNGATCEF